MPVLALPIERAELVWTIRRGATEKRTTNEQGRTEAATPKVPINAFISLAERRVGREVLAFTVVTFMARTEGLQLVPQV